MADRIPVVYDTDLGEDIDDLYALYLSLFHPKLELLAVTTAHGDTQLKARLARKVLRKVGREDIPVGAGVGLSQARIAHGQVNPHPPNCATFTPYVTEADPEWGVEFPPAFDVMRAALSRAERPVSLIGEGAMSNIAEMVSRANPTEREKLGPVAVMAGETHVRMSEYNVICDPEAAEVVFTCGLPVFMGTYFLTARLKMTMEQVDEHFGSRSNPLYEVLYDCTQLWGPRRGRKTGPVLYDLVPVFWLADPACVQTQPSTIRVELTGKYTRGQTVRVPDDGNGPVMESLELDADAMVREFLEIMHGAAKDLAG